MAFWKTLHEYFAQYPSFDRYCFEFSQNWIDRGKGIRDEPGVYLFLSGCIKDPQGFVVKRKELPLDSDQGCIESIGTVLYVGKAGTIRTGKNFGNQKLWKRITKGKQFGGHRASRIPRKMIDKGIAEITVLWFVTHDRGPKDLPSFAEARLLQEYYRDWAKLPSWNSSA